MKLRIKANKLENPEVSFISMVTRGANRMPFKIIKSEEKGMINMDISRVFKRDKNMPKPVTKATLFGVVVEKSDKVELIRKALSEKISEVKEVVEHEDGTVLFKFETGDEEGATVIRDSDQTLTLVKGFQEYDPKIIEFAEAIKVAGFMPGLNMASNVVQQVINNAMYAAPTGGGDVAQKVDKALEGFHGYVMGMLKSLPNTAFKIEAIVSECMAQPAVTKTESDPDDTAAADAAAAAAGQGQGASGSGEGVVDDDAAGKAVAGEPAADTPALVAKLSQEFSTALKSAIDSLQGMIQGVQTGVADLGKKVDEVTTAQNALKQDITTATDLARKADAAVKGTVIGGIPAGDKSAGPPVTKGEGSLGCMDTAFDRTVRRTPQSYTQRG